MSQIERYRQDHQEMIDLMTRVLERLQESELGASGEMVHALLAGFSRKLDDHLVHEDHQMYPQLLQHPDEKVRSIAKRYLEEMGGLLYVFQDFQNHWKTPLCIQNDPGGFVREARVVLDFLAKRILREDTELYPLIG